MANQRYWWAVLYPENMVPAWKERIGDILQLPGAYCVHDKDMLAEYKTTEDYERKEHVHCIVAFPNTTTYNNALKIFKNLSKEGCSCVNKVEPVNNIRHCYEYLIHNTETSKKQKKYAYPASERIEFNNFDIGAYEQIGIKEKNDMAKELCDVILNECFCNFIDFYGYVSTNYDSAYFEILKTYSGLFERLTKGNYQKHVMHGSVEIYSPAGAK